MSSFDKQLEEELEKLKKKKKVTEEPENSYDLGRYSYLPSYSDIGPVFKTGAELFDSVVGKSRTSLLDKEEEEVAPIKEEKGLDFFQKGMLEDGYQFGDLTKSNLATTADIGINAVKGVGGIVEGVADLILYGASGIAKATGNDSLANKIKRGAQASLMDELFKAPSEYLDERSYLGRTSEAIAQGLGQVGGIMATGGLGAAAGLGTAGVTALTTGVMGVSGMGSGMGEAYQGGATDGEAVAYGMISGAADALSELLFGGLGKGVNALGFNKGLLAADDLLAKKVSNLFSNQIAKNLAEYGVKASAEGMEEVVAGIAQAMGKKATYMSDEEFGKILQDENLLEQFIVGTVTSGVVQAPSLHIANKTKSDFVTGFNQNEQTVVKKEVETRISETEKDGKKLTSKQKREIEAQVEEALERGEISLDTIEEVLGGDDFTALRDTVTKENEALAELAELYEGDELKSHAESLLKDSKRGELQKKLFDSVYEKAKGSRLGESYRHLSHYEADLSKYNEKEQAIVKKAMESGVLNNSRKTHDFVDFVAKVSSYSGIDFEFTSNQKLKETGFVFDGTTINGYYDLNTNRVVINSQSKKYLHSLVGHEILHAVKHSGLYESVEKIAIDYAKQTNEYKSRLKAAHDMYDGKDGYTGTDGQAKIREEAVADMIGDYLFTDSKFVSQLSVSNPNVFQRIYNEVKHLWKLATAGSQQKKQLEQLKYTFEKALREKGNVSTTTEGDAGVRLSIRQEAPPKKTQKAYKLMRLVDGKLYPLFIGNNEEVTPGVWYNADSPNLSQLKDLEPGTHLVDMKTGEAMTWEEYAEKYVPKKKNGSFARSNPNKDDIRWANDNGYRFMYIEDKAGGKSEGRMLKQYGDTRAYYNWGINGKADSATGEGDASLYALRPGWHFGEVPSMHQIGYGDNKDIRLDNQVWVEVEMSADVDYNAEAEANWGGDIPTHIPTDGYYKFATNPTQKKTKKGNTANDVTKADWFVAGAFKVNRIISDVEADSVVNEYNRKTGRNVPLDYRRNGGRVFNAETMQVEDGVRYSLSDSDGRQLSSEQQEFFKDSAVRDENGNLKVMYHGTSSGGHTVFDPYGKARYGLFGVGSYFTDSKEVAQSYTKKGKGTSPQVYETYLNIKNPMDMDAPANPAQWKEAFPDAMFPESGTNEQFYRAMEEYFEDNEYPRWEAAEAAMEAIETMGYDGITHIGGGRFNQKDDTRHRVYIAFQPEQIKDVGNQKPTGDPDIRYSLSELDNAYQYNIANNDMLGAEMIVERAANLAMPNSKIRGKDGSLIPVYHGTHDMFYEFDTSISGGKNGTAEGYGIYTSDDPEVTEVYGERQIKMYANITKPATSTKRTITASKLAALIKDTCKRQAQQMVAEGEHDSVREALLDTWVSNYVYTYDIGMDRAYRETANSILQMNDNDMGIIQEVMAGMGIRDYAEATKFYRNSLTPITGFDGYVTQWENGSTGKKSNIILAFDSSQLKSADAVTRDDNGNVVPLTERFNPDKKDIRYSLSEDAKKLNTVGLQYDARSGTVSYSMTSLEDAFDYNKSEADYLAARLEYEVALAKSIAVDKENVTAEEQAKAKRYLDSLFLIHDMIARDRDKLDYEAAAGKSAWVSNAEYGGSVDFSTLCAKRRLFTGTFDAIQNELQDTVLDENDFLQIRNMLLAKELDSPCSMCYVEGSRAKHGVYVAKFLKEYLKTNPEWKPHIADFTSTTRLEQTRIQHPEAYKAYQDAMNALNQRKPKEASVRTDYKGEILRDFKDDTSVEQKNRNGGIRFNSFSDFEIIHAIDCMQVITDMARVGLNGQAYTKVKEFAEAFGNTGLKINLSLVAKDVDADGKLIMDEVNGMKYAEALDLRNRYSDNVGTVIVVFNEAQLKAALADSTIDYVLPFHRSQWKKSQYTMMGLPTNTRDFTSAQNDRIRNPKTGRYVKLSKIKHTAQYTNGAQMFEIKDNIMPNQYWDFDLTGRENAQRYLDYINSNGLVPKFNFLLSQENGKWVLPKDEVGDGYFKLLIDFKMYNNQGWGAPQNPVVPEFNMPYIQKMLEDYKGGHKAFPVAHDVVKEFVEGKKNHSFSLSKDTGKKYGDLHLTSEEIRYNPQRKSRFDLPIRKDIAPAVQEAPRYSIEEMFPDDLAPLEEELAYLQAEAADIQGAMEAMAAVGDVEGVNRLIPEFEAAREKIAALKADDAQRVASLDDADAPPVAPAVTDRLNSEIPDPMDARREMAYDDLAEAEPFINEHPELKPFIQAEARGMLGDLQRGIRGERFFSEVAWERGGNEIAWTGVSRSMTDEIVELRDTYRYSYDQIEKALNAIIEDRVTKRHKAAKVIEIMLNDAMLYGTKMEDGMPIPPNQEYIRKVEEMAAEESRKGAFDSFMESIGDNIPPMRTEPLAYDTRKDMKGQETVYTQEYILDHRHEAMGSENIGPVYAEVNTSKGGDVKKQQALGKEFIKKESDKRAEILVEAPVAPKKKNPAISMAKEYLLDNGMVFEDVAKENGNRELEAKWHNIRNAGQAAQWFIEHGDEGVSSLNAIRKEVESSGKTQEFYDYLHHQLNVDRMTLEDRYEDVSNKSVFGDEVTAEVSRKEAKMLERANPEFKLWAQEVYSYMNHLRSLMVKAGVISQETADLWAEMYPHYIPIHRVGKDGSAVNVPLDTGRTGVNAPIKRATGGNSSILPLFNTMGERTLQTFKAIAKNSFGVELKNTLGTEIAQDSASVDSIIDSLEMQDELLQEGKNGNSPTFTVFENGEKVTFEITEEMYTALKPRNEALSYRNKVLNTASNIHRGVLTEYNPTFMATNAIKDVQDILINSQHPGKTYLAIPKAVREMRSKGRYYTEYMSHGGEQQTYFDNDSGFDQNQTWEKVKKWTGLGFISKANNVIERLPRLAEYIASREAGRSIEVSMLDAARVTTNFQAGGAVTKFLNGNGVTFLNASVQGAVQQVRNIREAKMNGLRGMMGLAARYLVAGLPVLLANHFMWDDDEEYEELSDYVKQNYYIVAKYGDGKFVRIPKGRTVAVIQEAFQQMENLITGNDEVDFMRFVDLAVSNLAPNSPLDNNIIAPVRQVRKNTTWYGEDLVPSRLEKLPAAEQYDETTDSISKQLGEWLNYSPVKINYLLDQYTGGLGDLVLPMLTPEAERGDNQLLAPFLDKFTTDSVMKNQNVSDFYTTMDELTANANSYKATDEDIVKYKYMNSVNSELSKLYAQKREIQNSSMPDKQKYEAVRDIQQQIVDITKNALGTYGNVSFHGDYATVGDRHFSRDDDGVWGKMDEDAVAKYNATSKAGDSPYATDGTNHYRLYVKDGKETWEKLSQKEVERQNEVTSGLGITPEEYWEKQEEYSYAYDHPENYAVAKSVGGYDSYRTYSGEMYDIKADKDENGKSISGSRKEKVIDYVNGLDIDYGMKLILFKNEYNADDTYNNEIIEYLNGRSDLSFSDIVTILRKIGFTVTDDGDISW